MEIPDLSRKCLSGQIPRSISRVKHHIQIHIQVTGNYFRIPNPEPNPEPSPRSYPEQVPTLGMQPSPTPMTEYYILGVLTPTQIKNSFWI
jgi:hypothetical protein